jgi:hypothetical protein
MMNEKRNAESQRTTKIERKRIERKEGNKRVEKMLPQPFPHTSAYHVPVVPNDLFSARARAKRPKRESHNMCEAFRRLQM